jgi:hypothetical protein
LAQQKDEQKAMLTEVEEEANNSDNMTATDGCIPTEIREAAAKAALDNLMHQHSSSEHIENKAMNQASIFRINGY